VRSHTNQEIIFSSTNKSPKFEVKFSCTEQNQEAKEWQICKFNHIQRRYSRNREENEWHMCINMWQRFFLVSRLFFFSEKIFSFLLLPRNQNLQNAYTIKTCSNFSFLTLTSIKHKQESSVLPLCQSFRFL